MKKTLIALLAVMLVAVACCAIASAEEYTCAYCGTTLVKWNTGKEPTCGDPGLITYHCPNSNCEKTGQIGLPATGKHTYERHIVDSEVKPTCGTSGYVVLKCDKCLDKGKQKFAILDTPMEHDWGFDFTARVSGPTCTKNATYIWYCKNCQIHETRELKDDEAWKKEDKKLGHPEANWKTVYVQAPSCTKPSIFYQTCGLCGVTLNESMKSKDALGHAWINADDKNPNGWVVWEAKDCTKAGTQYRKCSRCNLVEQKADPADGHKAPLTTVQYATRPKAKTFDKDVTIVVAGSCIARETRYYICKVCFKEVTEALGYKEHDFEETTISAKAGLKVRTCKTCGLSQSKDGDYGWVTTIKGKSIAEDMRLVDKANCNEKTTVKGTEVVKASTAAAKASAASTKANASGVSIPKTNDNTSTLPYVMMGIALVGIVALIASKRKVNG